MAQSPLIDAAVKAGAKPVEQAIIPANETRALTVEEEMRALIAQAEREDGDAAYQVRPPRWKLVAAAQSFQQNLTEEIVPKINAVIIASRITRTLWSGEEGETRAPICTSKDGREGVVQDHDAFVNMIPEGVDMNIFDPIPCHRCPFNQWGSGKAGRGKLCKETRNLLLMPEGAGMPALLSVPPSSVVNFDNYATGMKSKGLSYAAVVTTVSATKAKNPDGQDFSKVLFAPGRTLNVDELRIALGLRKQWEAFVAEVSDEEFGE